MKLKDYFNELPPCDKENIKYFVDFLLYLAILPLNILGEFVNRWKGVHWDYVFNNLMIIRYNSKIDKPNA